MDTYPAVTIQVNPALTADQLFDFYRRNNICEVNFGKEVATRVLNHPHVILAALAGNELVGIARATFDGLSAHLMEFSLDLRWQGPTKYANGSLIESDPQGLGRRIGQTLLAELERLGCTFFDGHVVDGCEERFYESLGFGRNTGHSVFYIDKRPYVNPV